MQKNKYLEDIQQDEVYYDTEAKSINLSKLDTSFYEMVQRAKNIGSVTVTHGKCSILAREKDGQEFTFNECNFKNTESNEDLEPIDPDDDNPMKCSNECVKINKNSFFGTIYNVPVAWTKDGKKAAKEVQEKMLTKHEKEGERLKEDKKKILNARAFIKKKLFDSQTNNLNNKKGYFAPTFLPCLVSKKYSNMAMVDITKPQGRYNYIMNDNINDNNTKPGLLNETIDNISPNSTNNMYMYEKYYELYDEIIYVKDKNSQNPPPGGISDDILLKIGSQINIGEYNKSSFPNTSTLYFNSQLNDTLEKYGFQRTQLKALQNFPSHRWDLSVSKKIFSMDDLQHQTIFKVLRFRRGNSDIYIIVKNGVITEINSPINNIPLDKHENTFGSIKYYDRIQKKIVKADYLNKNAVLSEFDIKNNTFTIKNNNKKGSTFRIVDATYNEWVNHPDKIRLYLSSLTHSQFNNNSDQMKININDKFNINGFTSSILFPNKISSEKKNENDEVRTLNNIEKNIINSNSISDIIINVKWGKKPISVGNKTIIKIEPKVGGIVELNDGSWFYNPGRIDFFFSFNNYITSSDGLYEVNNLFDDKSSSCRYISLPDSNNKGFCVTKPILESDYYNIKTNHNNIFKQCNQSQEGFINENMDYIKDINKLLNNNNNNKKKMMSIFFLSSGLLLLYLLFMLKKKK